MWVKQAYVIPTTNEQDEKITDGFKESQSINYDFLKANCANAVQSGLKAGGLKDGSLSQQEKLLLSLTPSSELNKLCIKSSPVHIFKRIINQNNNGTWLKRR